MYPAPFRFHRPSTLQEAIGLLSRLGDDAKVIAGGQSLIPMLKLRMGDMTDMIDIGRLPDLSYIDLRGDTVQCPPPGGAGSPTAPQRRLEAQRLGQRNAELAQLCRQRRGIEFEHQLLIVVAQNLAQLGAGVEHHGITGPAVVMAGRTLHLQVPAHGHQYIGAAQPPHLHADIALIVDNAQAQRLQVRMVQADLPIVLRPDGCQYMGVVGAGDGFAGLVDIIRAKAEIVLGQWCRQSLLHR